MKTRTKNSIHPKGRNKGFSLPEILGTVATISVFSTVGITAMNRQNDAIEDLQLHQQIKSLNAAAQAYEFSGGDLSNSTTPEDVLTRLKSVAVSTQEKQAAGLAGSMIDLRLEAVSLPSSEADSSTPRAIWNSSAKRFVYATIGANGIEKFRFNESAIPSQVVTESRNLSTEYAATDGWVWDYTDRSASGNSGSGDASSSMADLGDLPTTESSSGGTTQLLPPQFSIPGGTWEYPAFSGLELELINPNSEGSSVIYYSINDGPWNQYTNSINIIPNSEIAAFAQTIDPVSYTDSDPGEETYAAIPQLFQGTALGQFTGASGGYNMITSSSLDGLISSFSWGVGAYGSKASNLTFTGNSFSAASDGNLFSLGTLDYFNGTIWSGTGADSVDLQLQISFTVPETDEAFTFDLSLENTTNYGVSADADADYVRIRNTQSEFATMLNGVLYGLQLQFGYQGANGFSTVDEFHVHEGSSATANIYGLFVAVDYDDN